MFSPRTVPVNWPEQNSGGPAAGPSARAPPRGHIEGSTWTLQVQQIEIMASKLLPAAWCDDATAAQIQHLFLVRLSSKQSNRRRRRQGALYISVCVVGVCAASPLPFCILCCVCFVTWEFITYSQFCSRRIL